MSVDFEKLAEVDYSDKEFLVSVIQDQLQDAIQAAIQNPVEPVKYNDLGIQRIADAINDSGMKAIVDEARNAVDIYFHVPTTRITFNINIDEKGDDGAKE